MSTNEKFVGEVRNESGPRPFPVIYYCKPDGYTWNGEPVNCRTCKTAQAVFRAEIYNHLYEPQGSEYYCQLHLPRKLNITSE